MTTVTDEKIVKVFRNLHDIEERILKGSLDPDDLVRVLSHLTGKRDRARNLLEYSNANCPRIDWLEPSKPKARRSTKNIKIVDPLSIDSSMQVLELAEPFDFDSINEATAKNLGRTFYGDETILLTCDKPQGKQAVKIYLFALGQTVSCQRQADETKRRHLAPSPWHLIAYALKHPEFADQRYIGTQWQDARGKFCCAAFDRWRDERDVSVNQLDSGWRDRWWFAGVSKESLALVT